MQHDPPSKLIALQVHQDSPSAFPSPAVLCFKPNIKCSRFGPILAAGESMAIEGERRTTCRTTWQRAAIVSSHDSMLATLGMSSAIMEPGATARRPAKRQRLTWTDEENELILQKVKKLGTQWDRIAAELPGVNQTASRM